MLRIYGMSHEDFDRRLADQGGQCACCGRISDQMVVDHDHVTDVVRGIVCFGCNTGFGKLGDQAEGAHRAEMYLWKSRDLLAEFASGRHTLAEMFQAQVA